MGDIDGLRIVLASARARTALRDRTLIERVALEISNHWSDYALRTKWRDAMRGAAFSARLDRETAARCVHLGLPEAAMVALSDASGHERTAADIGAALRLYDHPPDFWTER